MNYSLAVLNHSVNVKLGKENDISLWKLDASVNNTIVRINSSSAFGNFTYTLKNLTFGLPTQSKDLNVTYQILEKDGHKFILAIKDTETTRYICNGTIQLNGTLKWNCSKQQVRIGKRITSSQKELIKIARSD